MNTRAPNGRWATAALGLSGIVLVAVNLRLAVASVGPVLGEIRADLRLGDAGAGLLTSVPVVTFAVFGAATPWLVQRCGARRITLLGLLATALGLAGRAVSPGAAVFLALSCVALAGIAVVNVVLPSLVKAYFPDRVGLVTAAYTTALAIGLTLATAVTVPIASAFGSWRWGVGIWAAVAVLATAPWLLLARHERAPAPCGAGGTITLRMLARTRLAWTMAAAFGVQSMVAYTVFGWFPQVYQDAGLSATAAGFLVGAATAVGIPVSFALPWLATRLGGYGPLAVALVGSYLIGFVGLACAPLGGAWVWAIAVGIGQGTFPLILTLIALRAHTAAGTAALSGFAQSVGYLIAAPGPVLIGILHGLTGSWSAPMVSLMAMAVALGVLCLRVATPAWIEDQIRSDPTPRLSTTATSTEK
ncbi:MAG: MFS transporter [Actinobacteria bacterium]|nr:MFS transporter [Actinomycetota bacterium]